MEILINAFNIILYQPLFNALVLLYLYLPGRDFGIAVIVLTVLIRFLFYPLTTLSIRSQKSLSELQPKIKEIQEKYKNDKEKQMKATMELYQKEKINPFSGCLPILIQLPVLIAIFQVFSLGFGQEQLIYLYRFVSHPGVINPDFLGIINLTSPSIFLAFFAGISQFIQSKMMTPSQAATEKQNSKKKGTPDFGAMMQKQMLYFFPIFTVFMLWTLPAAIGLYWTTTTIFAIIQHYFIFKKNPPNKQCLIKQV